MRCCDRSYHCIDDKYTKKLTQQDYEKRNTGTEFSIENRYNVMLTLIFVTMMFSAGMPILYPVAVLFFCVTYWFDKCLLLNNHCKPPQYDDYVALKSIYWFKYSLILHVLVGGLMFGNEDIFPVVKVYGAETLRL